jgi:hypothetical protein
MMTRTLASTLCAFALASCSRFEDSKLVGTWRHEDDEGIDEVTLGADHSYRSLRTFKQDFVTPSVIEKIGSWHLKRSRLNIDSTVTWSKDRSQLSLLLVEVTDRTLRTKDSNEKETFVFVRFQAPECTAKSSSITEPDLHGTWDFHYHTHDYRYSFASDGRVTLAGLISGEWSLIREGQWRLSGAALTIREKAVRGSPDEQEVKWTLSGTGADCLAFNDGSATYALRRASTP